MPGKIASLENDSLWEKLSAFEAPFLEEKLLHEKAFASADEYHAAFVEFKKYVFLCVRSSEKVGMTSKTVDAVWHQFILFTKEYAAFCQSHFGYFLHHVPRLPSQVSDKGSVNNFASTYKTYFGTAPAIWGPVAASTCTSSCHTNVHVKENISTPESCGPACSNNRKMIAESHCDVCSSKASIHEKATEILKCNNDCNGCGTEPAKGSMGNANAFCHSDCTGGRSKANESFCTLNDRALTTPAKGISKAVCDGGCGNEKGSSIISPAHSGCDGNVKSCCGTEKASAKTISSLPDAPCTGGCMSGSCDG